MLQSFDFRELLMKFEDVIFVRVEGFNKSVACLAHIWHIHTFQWSPGVVL